MKVVKLLDQIKFLTFLEISLLNVFDFLSHTLVDDLNHLKQLVFVEWGSDQFPLSDLFLAGLDHEGAVSKQRLQLLLWHLFFVNVFVFVDVEIFKGLWFVDD